MGVKGQKGPTGSNNPSGKNVRHLTDKQKRFAREFVYNDGSKTKTQCAIDAGYSKTRAGVSCAELTNPRKCPLVVRYRSYKKNYNKSLMCLLNGMLEN